MYSVCAILSSVACQALLYFSTLYKNGNIFEKKLSNIKSVFQFSLQLCMNHFLFYELSET